MSKENFASINLDKNRVIVIKDGQPIEVEGPQTGFGEQSLIWVHGKVDRVVTSDTKKI